MAFRETIHLLIDVDGRGATSGVGKLRTELANTDGAFSKLRVGAAGAFDLVKQHAATAALAAGAALVGFATKAVSDFQDVALGAGQLASSLGITTEEASRLQEVAGDLGIGVSTVERAIGRMNREIANSPEKFDAIGAAIARNEDGTTNVTQTFLNVIDALNNIPDPARRAAAAQEVLGRGWQDASRLIALGADGVADALDRVEDAKIMTPAQVAQAEKFRDALDELKGVGESASLIVGDTLVPALTDVAGAAKGATDAVAALNDALGGRIDLGDLGRPPVATPDDWGSLADAVVEVGLAKRKEAEASDESAEANARETEAVDDTTESMDVNAAATDKATVAAEKAEQALGRATSQFDRQRKATDDATKALEDHRAELLRGVGQAFAYEEANLRLTTGVRAFEESMKSGEKSAEELRLEELALAGQALSTAEAFAAEQTASGNAASAADLQRLKLAQLQDQYPGLRDEIQVYIDKLNAIPASKTTTINLRQGSTVAAGPVGRGIGIEHSGTPAFQGGGVALVGEHGPEAVFLPSGSKVTSQSETKAMLGNTGSGGGRPMINNFYFPAGVDPAAVQRAIRRYERRNGPQ